MRESDIHKHLVKQVKSLGGEVRRVKWIGRSHAPDVLVMLPHQARHFYVEEKRPDAEARDGQLREHERMRKAGCIVLVLDTIEKIDAELPLP